MDKLENLWLDIKDLFYYADWGKRIFLGCSLIIGILAALFMAAMIVITIISCVTMGAWAGLGFMIFVLVWLGTGVWVGLSE